MNSTTPENTREALLVSLLDKHEEALRNARRETISANKLRIKVAQLEIINRNKDTELDTIKVVTLIALIIRYLLH